MSTSAISRSVGAPVLSGCRTFLTGAVVLLAGASCTNATVSSQRQLPETAKVGTKAATSLIPTVVAEGALFVLLPAEPAEPRSQNSWRPRTVAMAWWSRARVATTATTLNGDGCNALCQIEANYKCPTAGQPCINMAVCGNGILTSNEACDDGNTVSGDGCSGDCKTIEPGWQCRMPGKPCTPQCGDGVITSNEMCDDGNTVSGDGCSATCKIEIGYTCSGQPSVLHQDHLWRRQSRRGGGLRRRQHHAL